MKKIYALIASLFWLAAHADEPYLRFHHLTPVDGLSGGEITCFLQDRNGFIWIGSEEGLNKYDGYDIITYRHDNQDENSIGGNSVRSLFQDSRNNLWIGLKGEGLSRLNLSTGVFQTYRYAKDDPASLSYNDVAGVVEDENGKLWIAADRGSLDMFDPDTGLFYHYPLYDAENDRQLSNALTDIAIDSNGRIWLSSWGGGIYFFNKSNKSFCDILEVENASEERFCRHIFDLYLDKNGYLWCASAHGGLYRFDVRGASLDDIQMESVGSTNELYTKSVVTDADDNIWLITPDKVNVLDKDGYKEKYVFTGNDQRYGLLPNTASCIYADRSGTLWIGHPAGVSYYNPLFSQFSFVPVEDADRNNHTGDRRIMGLLKDRKGFVWVGGVNYLDRYDSIGTLIERHLPPNLGYSDKNRYNQALCEDMAGNVWVGAYSNVLLKYSGANRRFTRILMENPNPGKLPFGNVRDIYEDRDSTLWIATETGTVNYDPGSGEFEPLFQSERIIYPEDKSRVVFRDSRGELWIGTEGGLRRYSPEGTLVDIYKTQPGKNQLVNNYVTSLLEDGCGNFWVGTRGGLHLLDRDYGTFTLIKQPEMVSGDPVLGIGEDTQGNIWIGTTSQVLKYDHRLGICTVYNETDGLRGNGLQKVFYQAPDGQIFIGGAGGFNRFWPDKLRSDSTSNRVLVTDFLIFNRSVIPGENSVLDKVISETGRITIKQKQSVISFKFTAVNTIAPGKVKFRYMMEGFDQDWIQTGPGQRSVTYTNLDAGQYVFRVMATDNEGVWNTQSTDIEIKILPPFWKTGFAYMLYLVAILVLIYLLTRYFVVRERDRNSVRLAKLEARRAQELDNMRTELFTNISHEFRTPLTLILGPLEQIMIGKTRRENDEQLYKLMYRNVKRLQRLINQVLDFRKLEEGRLSMNLSYANIVKFIQDLADAFSFMATGKNIVYTVHSEIDSLWMNFDADKIDKILYNVISNAFKYTPDGGRIDITIRKVTEADRENVRIDVSDTGIGLSEEGKRKIFDIFYRDEKSSKLQTDGFGVGLTLTKALVEFHGGTIHVESKENEGSVFSIVIPIALKYPEQNIPLLTDDAEAFGATEMSESTTGSDGSAVCAMHNSKTLLVVEDNSDMRTYIRQILSDRFRIIEAANGQEGYDVAVERIPDIIICDIMMPVLDGMGMAKLIKSNDKTSHIPLVILTACHTESQVIEGLDVGADDYITKPFSAAILKTRLRNILDNRNKLWELYRRSNNIAAFGRKLQNPREQQFIEKLDEIITIHLSDPALGVEFLASEFCMSVDQLSRKVKALTNTTPYNIIIQARMQQAVNLMKVGSLNITEIAFAVGYQEVSHFSRAFKKYYGQSPRDYLSALK